MKGICTFLLTLALIVAMVGCAPTPTPTLQCNITIASTEGGNVTAPVEGIFTYDKGTVVNLVVTPDASYRFVEWTGDVGTIADVHAATTTITMNGDYSITANFVTQHSLTASSAAGGNVNTPGEGTFAYDEGTVVNLVATPDANYRFVLWAGDVGTVADVYAATTTIIMNDDYSITAVFQILIPPPWGSSGRLLETGVNPAVFPRPVICNS